ncbi:UDP-glucuronosyltransferase 1-1 [Lingula anatina]|uniref:UDP-glucuronosyltransferase n=1 Tax=Lingula anatina TaxID=7574 RepID=A0A1S3H0V4_LINAN|nr:UDP-glucuronosyltransferase 1-1 [Lingula anatina]XP_013379771.1 UDP-glucuronosyltransferase 1-1 [Lingula anatina]|eukprot:XP_013379770.1 UDP-glucuronosyltransferase 1-1 [Lingula anatina]
MALSLTQTLVFGFTLFIVTKAGNILMAPYSHCINSHMINLEILSWYLSENGHNVTLLVPEPYRGPYVSFDIQDTNIQVLRFKDPSSVDRATPKLGRCEGFDSLDSFRRMDVNGMRMTEHSTSFKATSDLFADNATLTTLIRSRFQVVITDYFWLCGYAVAAYLKIPLVTVQMLPGAHVMQIPDLYPAISFTPDNYEAISDNMSFFERVRNAWQLFVLRPLQRKYVDWIFYPRFHKIMLEHGFSDPDPNNVFNNITLGFMNSDFLFDYPGPVYSDMLFIGGFFNQWVSKPKKPLYKNVMGVIESSDENGIIVVSFGSMLLDYEVKWAKAFADAFARLPHKVIWRYPQLNTPPLNLGQNTLLMEWLPQPYLLSHPKVKLFISHCGAGAAYESIFHGVPVLGIPLAGDQPANCKKLSDRLFVGKCVDISTLTSETLFAAIQGLLHNSTIRSNARRVSQIFKERVTAHGPNILRSINSVLAEGGAHYLHPKTREMVWYQKYLIDLIVVVFAGVAVLSSTFYYCLCSSPESKSQKKVD